MEEKWIDDMRRKLEGHKMTPPPGLWESISKQMGLSEEPVRKPATRRWYWVAAAVVLALVGFFAFYQPKDVQTHIATKKTVLPKEQKPQTNPNVLTLATNNNKMFGTYDLIEEKQPDAVVSQPEEIISVSPDSIETQQIYEEPQQREKTYAEISYPESHHTPQFSVPNSKLNRWTVGLKASGGLLAANNSVRTDRLYQDTYAFVESSIKSYTCTEFVTKHHLPVRFGLSVQYQLNSHLALLSGINYTLLHSEFSIPLYPNINYSQKLHYLGVPLGIAWQLWSVNHFHLYLSGAAMVEKCVSADMGEGSGSKKPWQWSVNAAAGAEYDLTPQFGIYLEPSLGYFFDDGTSLEHYYKEHPLAPSIEFGLRLHFTK